MLQSNIKTEVIPEDETEIILKSLDFLDIKFDSVTGKAYINNRLYPALVKIGTKPLYNSNGSNGCTHNLFGIFFEKKDQCSEKSILFRN